MRFVTWSAVWCDRSLASLLLERGFSLESSDFAPFDTKLSGLFCENRPEPHCGPLVQGHGTPHFRYLESELFEPTYGAGRFGLWLLPEASGGCRT